MARDIRINLIAKEDVSGALRTISVEADNTSEALGRAGSEGAEGLNQVSDAADQASQSLESSATQAGLFGAAITSALVVPLGLGAKAAFDQVSAVEQATFALGAYSDSASEVQAVLQDLTEYAQDAERSGGIFWSEDLYATAQQLVIVGVELENVSEYVQIMTRAAGLGTVSLDEMSRVLQRVITSGRLTGIEFEMLSQWGFQIDETFRNTTITTEELFAILDEGIPADALLGQADAIEGAFLYAQGALVNFGQAFLGVNDDLEFVAGGLGDQFVGAVRTSIDVLTSLEPVARGTGEVLAFLAAGAGQAVDIFLALPQGVQTTIVSLVGGFGALTVGASATVLAFNRLSAAGTATMATFRALGGIVRAHPILFIASVVGGVALSAWARHRQGVEETQAAYEEMQAALESVHDTMRATWLSGDVATASLMEVTHATTRAGIDRWERELDRGRDLWGEFTQAVIDGDQEAAAQFAESNFFKSVMDIAEREGFFEGMDESVVEAILRGDIAAMEQYLPQLNQYMEQYWESYRPTEEDRAAIAEATSSMFELLMSPEVDSGQVTRVWNELLREFITEADQPNLQGFVNAWADAEAGMVTSITNIATSLDGLTDAQREFNLEMAQLRLDGDGALADDLESIRWLIGDVGQLSEEAAGYVEFFIGNVESGNFALSDYSDELYVLQQMYRNGIIDQEAYERGLMDIAIGAAEAEIATRELVAELHGVGAELNSLVADAFETELAMRSLSDAVDAGLGQGVEAYAEAHAEYLERVTENLNALIDVAGYGDPLSRWNIEGNSTKLSILAMNAQHAAGSLDSIFRVAVGNTDAIGSQFEQIFQWAEELIDKEGEWSKLDDLVISGRIEGTIGDFTDGSEYAQAQQAFNSLAEDNERVQESILTIQAKQAPLIAEQANAYADLMYEISEMPAEQQLITLGWMDSTTAMRAMEFQTLAVAAATGELGENGEEVFANMIIGAAQADPVLKALLIDMGLISEGADGTITVNFAGVEEGRSEIGALNETIGILIDLLDDGEINGSFSIDAEDSASPIIKRARQNLDDADGDTATMEIHLSDFATGGINAASWALDALDGRIATTTIQTIYENRGIGPTRALGGFVGEYASGGVLFRGGEIGPEIAHFATGGTALLPRDGFYSAPAGTYISPNNAISNSYGAPQIQVNVNGPVFGVPDLVAQISEELVPVISDVFEERTRGMGMPS